MDSSCSVDGRSPNLSLAKMLTIQSSLKRRKDCIHPSSQSSATSMQSGEAEVVATKVYSGASREHKNLGSPLIVEDFSHNPMSLEIPEALRTPKISEQERFTKNVSYKPNAVSAGGNAQIIVAQSLLSNTSPFGKNNDNVQKMQLNKKSTPKESADNKTQKSENVAVSSTSCAANEKQPAGMNPRISKRDAGAILMESLTANLKKSKPFESTSHPNAPRFYCLKNRVVVIMKKTTKFCFTGKLILKVIYGVVEAYGSLITAANSPTEVYSPRGYSSVAIATSNKSVHDDEINIWDFLTDEGINCQVVNEFVRDIYEIEPGMAVILLSNLENKLTKFLNTFYPFRLFPNVINQSCPSWNDPRRAEIILQSNLYFGNLTCKELIINARTTAEIVEQILNRWRANEWSCALIAGGKNVGKSTSTRVLINNILPISGKVVLVDLDPGQTECTPPGCISYSLIEQPLMGPNFTHLKTPVYQLYIGDVNVANCITRYIEGIKMLMEKLTSCPTLSRLPIIVNTMGFTHGIGWDIIVFTIKLVRPSLVVQIMSRRLKNNYSNYLTKETVNQQNFAFSSWGANVVDWDRPCTHDIYITSSNAETKTVPGVEAWNMEPYHRRELVMISYLSDIVQCSDSPRSRSAESFSINAALPYMISLSSLIIFIPQSCVPSSHVMNVMNGNIVALCGIDLTAEELRENRVQSGPRVLSRSPPCTCYGFGIVRGVDVEKKEIFINTPLSAFIMQYVNCLAGCIPIPVTLLQLNQQGNVPYTGGSDLQPTSREPRRGYFRMRYHKAQNKS